MAKKLGAPTKLTRKLIKQISDEIREKCLPATVVAANYGVPKSTFMNWQKQGRSEADGLFRELVDAIELALEKPHSVLFNVVYASGAGGVTADAKWLLERMWKDIYGKQQADDDSDTSHGVQLNLFLPQNGRDNEITEE